MCSVKRFLAFYSNSHQLVQSSRVEQVLLKENEEIKAKKKKNDALNTFMTYDCADITVYGKVNFNS